MIAQFKKKVNKGNVNGLVIRSKEKSLQGKSQLIHIKTIKLWKVWATRYSHKQSTKDKEFHLGQAISSACCTQHRVFMLIL